MLEAAELQATASPPLVALGVLSTMGAFGRGRSSAAQSATRRELVRNSTRPFVHSAVALRFVMAMPSEFEGVKHREALVARAHEEHARHGDIAILNATESFFTCPLKYLLWLRVAPSLYNRRTRRRLRRLPF